MAVLVCTKSVRVRQQFRDSGSTSPPTGVRSSFTAVAMETQTTMRHRKTASELVLSRTTLTSNKKTRSPKMDAKLIVDMLACDVFSLLNRC